MADRADVMFRRGETTTINRRCSKDIARKTEKLLQNGFVVIAKKFATRSPLGI